MATKPKAAVVDGEGEPGDDKSEPHRHNFKTIKDKDGKPATGLVNVRCSCGAEGHRR